MIRIGVVVQRYGREVVGGAETLARDVAERLARQGLDVTVYTTTAQDYITWKNHYRPGESILKRVLIKRFWVEKERDIKQFNSYSDRFFAAAPEKRNEKEWMEMQGPVCPDLIAALKKEQKEIDVFLFFTYLYLTTVEGLKVLQKPVILFPTAHDEPPLGLELMKDVFSRPDALFFLTRAEMELIKDRFNPRCPIQLIRSGIAIDETVEEKLFRQRYFVVAPFILYAGRIEKGKGLEAVFDYFQTIKKKRLIQLVLIGGQLMDIPTDDGIRYAGFVSEEEKLSAFKGAVLSLQPSMMESLSISTLESFSQRTPVLVNSQSQVLLEHIRLSGGGLSYGNESEFVEAFHRIYDNRRCRLEMGNKGFDYVRKYYSWDVVIERIQVGIRALSQTKNEKIH